MWGKVDFLTRLSGLVDSALQHKKLKISKKYVTKIFLDRFTKIEVYVYLSKNAEIQREKIENKNHQETGLQSPEIKKTAS